MVVAPPDCHVPAPWSVGRGDATITAMTHSLLLRSVLSLVVAGFMLSACGDDDGDDESGLDRVANLVVDTGDAEPVGGLVAGSTWQWQIAGPVNTGYDVDIYDVDLVDTPVSTIEELHADGRVVICYFSAGSHEEWRGDASRYPADAIGEPLGDWPGERWIDVRDETVRAIQLDRLDLAVAKGCDGVEPDNVAAHDDDNGFGFTLDDQLDFNRFLAKAAHDRGLLIGLKNALGQIPELVDHYDFAVNEECHEYEECDVYGPFLAAGKPVLNAEYAERFVDDPAPVCNAALAAGTRTLILPLDLDDSFRIDCP